MTILPPHFGQTRLYRVASDSLLVWIANFKDVCSMNAGIGADRSFDMICYFSITSGDPSVTL